MGKLKRFVLDKLQRYLNDNQIISRPLYGQYYGDHAGMRVTETTAMTLSAVYRAINYISNSIMVLPWGIFATIDGNQRRVQGSHLEWLLNGMANDELAYDVWRQTITQYAVIQGNGWCEIGRDALGNAAMLGHPIPDSHVKLMRDEQTMMLYCRITLTQENEYLGTRGTYIDIPYSNMYHLRGMGNSLLGHSVVGYAARSMGVGLALDQSASSFFGNGNRTSGVIEYPGQLGPDKKIELGKYIKNTLQGPQKTNNMLVLDQGMKWSATGMPNDDAQFLESRVFAVKEIARWFNLPTPVLMEYGDTSWGTAEQASIDAVMGGLLPWVTRMESQAVAKLAPAQLRRQISTKLNLQGLLRADTETRSKAYASARQWGFMSANEIRQIENMPEYEGGDTFLTPVNMREIDGPIEQPIVVPGDRLRMKDSRSLVGALMSCVPGAQEGLADDELIYFEPGNDQSKSPTVVTDENIIAGLAVMLSEIWYTIVTREANELIKIKGDNQADKARNWLKKHRRYCTVKLSAIPRVCEALRVAGKNNLYVIGLAIDDFIAARVAFLAEEIEQTLASYALLHGNDAALKELAETQAKSLILRLQSENLL